MPATVIKMGNVYSISGIQIKYLLATTVIRSLLVVTVYHRYYLYESGISKETRPFYSMCTEKNIFEGIRSCNCGGDKSELWREPSSLETQRKSSYWSSSSRTVWRQNFFFPRPRALIFFSL
jgi:hypothetical protein